MLRNIGKTLISDGISCLHFILKALTETHFCVFPLGDWAESRELRTLGPKYPWVELQSCVSNSMEIWMAELEYRGKSTVVRATNAKSTTETHIHRAEAAGRKSRLTLNSINSEIRRTRWEARYRQMKHGSQWGLPQLGLGVGCPLGQPASHFMAGWTRPHETGRKLKRLLHSHNDL